MKSMTCTPAPSPSRRGDGAFLLSRWEKPGHQSDDPLSLWERAGVRAAVVMRNPIEAAAALTTIVSLRERLLGSRAPAHRDAHD
jgi:hypothetical protein